MVTQAAYRNTTSVSSFNDAISVLVASTFVFNLLIIWSKW